MKTFYQKIVLSLAFIFVFVLHASAWSWLNVQNPRTWDKWGQGTIEDALLTVQPKGIYIECELYLTFSGRDNNFLPSDTLEISYYFSLPSKSIVHDSWLWVGDSIVHARLIDRWSAWQIYESIVKRRRDPSLLYKQWGDYYSLQIYPMMGNEQRKAKITFLVPASWTARSVSCPIPTDMLQASKIPLEKLRVLVKESPEFQNPSVPVIPEASFKRTQDPDFGPCLETFIPGNYIGFSQIYLSFSHFVTNGLYLSTLNNGAEGIYQMAILPSKFFQLDQPKKLLFLFDFEKKNEYQAGGNQVYAELKNLMANYLDENDYFNIIFSGPQPMMASNSWVKATPENMRQVFSMLGSTPVQNFSGLQELLTSGIKFIQKTGNKGSMVLLANTDHYATNDSANLLMDYLKTFEPLPVTHIVDFDNSYTWYYFGGKYFRGNEYFYTLLTRHTKGNYYQYNYWDNNIADMLTKVFEISGGKISSFDLHTSMKEGFCYGRFNIEDPGQAIYLDKPILQVGKYYGNLPFVAELAGIYNGQPLMVRKEIPASQIIPSDTLLAKMWAGNHIASLENTWNYDNEMISQIVESSLSNRVLSVYTAFLALEPGMEYSIEDPGNPASGSNGAKIFAEDGVYSLDRNGQPSSQTTGINENSIQTTIFPNPFHNRTRITISINNFRVAGNIKFTIAIYDITGRKVTEFDPHELFFNGTMSVEWDGTDASGRQLKEGIYYLQISSTLFKKNVRLIKL